MLDPEEVAAFKQLLFDAVESFEELEILIAFHERGGGTLADAEVVAHRIGATPERAAGALDALIGRGFLTPAGDSKRFAITAEVATRESLGVIVREYRSNPLLVMKLMTENAIERVRTAALHTFAGCFRIRGPGSNG